MISDTVCIQHTYAFRKSGASGKLTNSVMASAAIESHKGGMLDHETIRDELIRQLDAGEVKAVSIAKSLGIAEPRVFEMRNRKRRVQQHEMGPLAQLLGLMTDQPELVTMAVALPSVRAMTQMFEGLLEALDRPDLVDELALPLAQHFPTALRRTLDREYDLLAGASAPPIAGEQSHPKDRRAPQ